MQTLDFTRMPLGALVASSRTVIRCPQCRRHGVLESYRDGTRICVHAETTVLPGMVALPTDRCQFAGPREGVSRPAQVELASSGAGG